MKYRILTAMVVHPSSNRADHHSRLRHLRLNPGGHSTGADDHQSGRPNLQSAPWRRSRLTANSPRLIDQFVAPERASAWKPSGALTDPFTDLASVPTRFIGVGLSWKSDFTGVAAELASSVEQMGETGKSFTQSWRGRLTAADTVTESDILTLYDDYRPEIAAGVANGYLAAREEGDKRLVLDHAMSDAAANLMIAARDAVESYEGLRNNTNTSNTALAQSQVAGTVTQGNLTAAMAQLMAFQAAKEAAEDYEREIARREALARWIETQRRAEITFAAQQAGLDARRDSMREGLLFRIHPAYGGNGQ